MNHPNEPENAVSMKNPDGSGQLIQGDRQTEHSAAQLSAIESVPSSSMEYSGQDQGQDPTAPTFDVLATQALNALVRG